jgi:hypothetical protein
VKRRYVVLLPFLLLLAASPAGATAGDTGHDIAAPQCGSGVPLAGSFGIVGVNGGTAWSANPCLQTQAAWAAALPTPMLYANTANPAPTSSFYWPTTGASDPAYCANASSTTDPGCAYDYGWHTADDALSKAAAQSALNPTAVTWWLDVESANTWRGDGISNAADLQGMVDRLRSAGVPDVGIYANSGDWQLLTGSGALGTSAYTRGVAGLYRSHWPFAPKYPIEDGPVWFAGLNDLSGAQARCGTTSLTGGERLLAQYDDPDSAYDGDYRCADRDLTAPTVALTAPATGVVTLGTTKVTWSGSDGGSGIASYDLQRATAPSSGVLGAWSYSRRLLTTSSTTTSPARGSTSCWYVRSRDAAGNVSALSVRRCVIRPLDDRDLSASSGWTRTTAASGWFNSSFTTSTRLGATLTRTGVRTSHLELLAYRCPTCGSVKVLLNGVTFKTVSLASSTSGRVRIALPRFSLRTTTVSLRVATSGKLVRIDGLATSGII